MKISDLLILNEKPTLYEKGSSFMWTDPYISEQLLQIHLNPDIDIASRKKTSIVKSIQWILEKTSHNETLNILDLGCGPGLYTEQFAERGHKVTGIDISKNSIEYAIQSAKEKKLDINYQNSSYLDTNLGKEKYDLVVLIYTDFGVLTPYERDRLLTNVFESLKTGGTFIFDVLKDKNLNDKLSPRSWEVSDSGFWKEAPYLALSDSFLYEEEKVILFQHAIMDDSEKVEIYRFWTHFFSQEDITQILNRHKYRKIIYRDDILPSGDLWNGDNVVFVKCEK